MATEIDWDSPCPRCGEPAYNPYEWDDDEHAAAPIQVGDASEGTPRDDSSEDPDDA